MKGKFGILMVIAALYPSGAQAGGISVLGPSAAASDSTLFTATVNYAVSLPMANDDVVYTVNLASVHPEKPDTLCPVDYLIDWQLPREEGISDGFLAYFDGHHYRYRNNRLQEYHFEWDSIPFQQADGGVQRAGQFVDLLPAFVYDEINRMKGDSTFRVDIFPDTLISGRKSLLVKAVQNIHGFDGRYYTLLADAATLWPLRIENEYNPGQISEQQVVATYNYPSSGVGLPPLSEEELIERYPEVFEKYRESNYAITNLVGLPMPAFSLPTLTGERYTHHRLEPFPSPTVLSIIDPTVATAGETIAALRKAVEQAPQQINLLLAFTTNSIDEAEALVGPLRPGEAHLMSARSLARDCGTTAFPTIIILRPDGNVADVRLGFNNSLTSDVIQSVSLL